MRRPASRILKGAIAAVAGVAMLSGLAACSSSGGDSSSSGSESGSFPVTIKQAQGDVTIKKAPKRVVTMGWGATDNAIALGVTPVGMERADWGGDKNKHFPWIAKVVKDKHLKMPENIQVYPEIDMKKLVSLKPDLILAPYSGFTAEKYKQLSELAPTVTYPKAAWATSWQDAITIAGKALGKQDAAKKQIDSIQARFDKAKKENPEFEGKTLAYLYANVPGKLSVYLPGDQRLDYLSYLGFTQSPEVKTLMQNAKGATFADLGLEKATELNSTDVVLSWFDSESVEKTIEAQPLYADIAAVKRGSYLPMHDPQIAMARTLITSYAMDYAFDGYVKDLKTAVSKAK